MKNPFNKGKNAEHIKVKKRLKSIHQLPKNSNVARKKFSIGPYVTATLTAILIGLFLGLIMLNLFSNKGDGVNVSESKTAANQGNTNHEEQASQGPTSLQQINAYVLQVGVFEEKGNADNWSDTYQQQGFSTTSFFRDNQYFLFIGLADTEETAKKFAATLLERGIEVYVKEWTVNGIEKDLTPEEAEWMQLFQEQWHIALKSLGKQKEMRLNDWKELIDGHPTTSKLINSFIEGIQPFFEKEIKGDGDFSLQNDLLNVLKSYEEIIIYE